MKRHLLGLALLATASAAQAHAGHGLPGAVHWHASDAWLLLAIVGAAALWLARRR